MPILFICSRETDYLQDLTYAGLAEILGKEQIADFPVHWPYHREKKFIFSKKIVYPLNVGYVPSGVSSPHFSSGKFRQALKKNQFNLVVLASAKPDALNRFAQIFDEINVPWIFLDGGDWPEVGGDFKREGGEACLKLFQSLCRKKAPAMIFKREFRKNLAGDNIFPLQFSVNPSKISILSPDNAKEIQVLFWAVESSAVRKKAFQILKGKYDCDENGSIPGRTFRKYASRGQTYFEALNSARIALSFRGEGFDTMRYWEIPACGTLMISERPTIEIPNNFVDRKRAVFCRNDLSDLLELIDYYLAHESESREISAEGQKQLLRYHTHRHRAEFVIDTLRIKLKLKLG